MKKYTLHLRLEDLKEKNRERELHFKIQGFEDNDIIEALKKDFTLLLSDIKWVMSAKNGNHYSSIGLDWYVQGSKNEDCKGHKRKYYNKSAGTYHYMKDFNKNLVELFPRIEDRVYTGEFDIENRTMEIKKEF